MKLMDSRERATKSASAKNAAMEEAVDLATPLGTANADATKASDPGPFFPKANVAGQTLQAQPHNPSTAGTNKQSQRSSIPSTPSSAANSASQTAPAVMKHAESEQRVQPSTSLPASGRSSTPTSPTKPATNVASEPGKETTPRTAANPATSAISQPTKKMSQASKASSLAAKAAEQTGGGQGQSPTSKRENAADAKPAAQIKHLDVPHSANGGKEKHISPIPTPITQRDPNRSKQSLTHSDFDDINIKRICAMQSLPPGCVDNCESTNICWNRKCAGDCGQVHGRPCSEFLTGTCKLTVCRLLANGGHYKRWQKVFERREEHAWGLERGGRQ